MNPLSGEMHRIRIYFQYIYIAPVVGSDVNSGITFQIKQIPAPGANLIQSVKQSIPERFSGKSDGIVILKLEVSHFRLKINNFWPVGTITPELYFSRRKYQLAHPDLKHILTLNSLPSI
ncbi:MAG: hypothetical protein MZV64_29975 [Ignavibacteriales bacterium]|nr:hypothetical protein [Ignavibacteriales bacterium]